MHRIKKVAQGSVGDSLRNNIDEQIGKRNISIARETAAYENRERRRKKKENNFSFPLFLIDHLTLIEDLLISFHINILRFIHYIM